MKIKELLTDNNKWTKRCFSRTSDGIPVQPCAEEASCWCLLGAIRYCYGYEDESIAIVKKITDEIKADIYAWNDAPNRIFQDVRNVVEKLDI